MNINDIKDFQIQKEKLLIETKSLFKQFKNLSKILDEKIVMKKKEYCEILIIDFKKYFEENQFIINIDKDGTVSAQFKEYKITAKIEKTLTCMISSPQNMYCSIEIRPENKSKKLLEWKNIIKYKDFDLFIYDSIGLSNYSSDIFFDKINDLIILDEIKNKIVENIEYYKDTINNFDSIIFVYSFFESESEFNKFVEIVEKL